MRTGAPTAPKITTANTPPPTLIHDTALEHASDEEVENSENARNTTTSPVLTALPAILIDRTSQPLEL
jgi:hypothetical protein